MAAMLNAEKLKQLKYNESLVGTFVAIHGRYPERDAELHELLKQFLYKIKVEEMNFKAKPGEGAEIINFSKWRAKKCGR